jgi:hypothetical protein
MRRARGRAVPMTPDDRAGPRRSAPRRAPRASRAGAARRRARRARRAGVSARHVTCLLSLTGASSSSTSPRCRAGGRHPLPQPVPRRPDRRARQSLLTQGEIIAGAIAASATVETDSITIDPDRLLELQAGESLSPSRPLGLEFPINPERSRRCCAADLADRTRARIYDRDGMLILDSATSIRAARSCASTCRRPQEEDRRASSSGGTVQRLAGCAARPAGLPGTRRRQRRGYPEVAPR